jgi:hypothetical protein
VHSSGAQDPEPDLKTVLRRAAEYVTDYHTRLSEIVAEEHYVQRIGPDFPTSSIGPRSHFVQREKVLKSDFVLVRGFTGTSPWLGVREVFEIDGEPVVGDRGRLRTLLTDPNLGNAGRLRALADQQARYNLGDLYRTINVPTVPLDFLLPDRQPRFRFKRSGKTVMRGTPVVTVTYHERTRPTLIRTPEGNDVTSSGVFWIDPQMGAVLRTELRAGGNLARRLRSIILVSYAHHERFGMLLPEDMNELYVAARTRIEGHATYTNFRRFETETRIR